MREGQKPFWRSRSDLGSGTSGGYLEICHFYFHAWPDEIRTDARLEVYFPPASDWLTIQYPVPPSPIPKLPNRPGKTMGKRKRIKDKSESTKSDASSLLPQVSTVLFASVAPSDRVHIFRKDITGSAPTRILSPITTSSTQLLRMKWTGAHTIPHLLDRERNPSLRM